MIPTFTDKNFTISGCSYTYGEGLPLNVNDKNNYINIVSDHFKRPIKNLAKCGNSNYNIFFTALKELTYNPPEILFVQWTGLKRFWLYPGFDTELFISLNDYKEYRYRDLIVSSGEMKKFTELYYLLSHDYNSIVSLIEYCDILHEISQIKNCQVIMINGGIPWTPDLLNTSTAKNFSDSLSEYSKDLLEFNSRDDEELIKLFNKLQTAMLTLKQEKWVNLFSPFKDKLFDLGTDNSHPGPKSHRLYADMIIKYLEGTHV